MKRKPSVLSLMSATLLGIVLMTFSCKKDVQEGGPNSDRALSATIIIPANPTLSGVLGTGHNIKDTIRLTKTTTWHLNGLVYVDSSDVLLIDAGTTIKGDTSTSTAPGGGLVICRGAKILAIGKADSAIVFTSGRPGTPRSGDWSGVVILGNASSNHSGRVQVEGIPSNPPASATFGGSVGTNDADNSGTLQYVRIEYGGYELSPDNEINGLTLGGVGSGTVIDHICVFKSKDDAIEWFGGTVNVSYVLAIDALDDMFDTDNGYRGQITNALGLSDTTRADKSTSNGFESDNDALGDCATPVTSPKYRNITIIGQPRAANANITNGQPSTTGKYGRAAHIRRSASFDIDNAIFLGFNMGISLDTALFCAATGNTAAKYRANHATWLQHTIAHAYYNGGTPAAIGAFITESNGNPIIPPTAFGSTLPGSFYNYAIGDGNIAITGNPTNPNTGIGLANPFNRSSAANFITLPGTAGRTIGGGAFPGGTNWVTGNWAKFQ